MAAKKIVERRTEAEEREDFKRILIGDVYDAQSALLDEARIHIPADYKSRMMLVQAVATMAIAVGNERRYRESQVKLKP